MVSPSGYLWAPTTYTDTGGTQGPPICELSVGQVTPESNSSDFWEPLLASAHLSLSNRQVDTPDTNVGMLLT